ncbi:hypothetical protein LTR36_001253 [Oleoguttula mirabilis]|uniref:Phosphodiesterase n=1 Tax=Oleoguttula mirabilis TaxID=1507867 RepID=A0AAV9JNQ0_9PEZI|nr:hypothetical protein LTR36_001253 [Oleoguttula mirabilis]
MEEHVEEHADDRCSVVYFCGGLEEDVCEVYHEQSPPRISPEVAHEDAALDNIYSNIRMLLDENQGGCHEVFVSSRAHMCRDRLETYANSVPTVVLIELRHDIEEGSRTSGSENEAKALPFLRALSADIQGARYQKHVMPFALLRSRQPVSDFALDAGLTSTCLGAGALDLVHSPLGHEDMNRLVGHIREATRPSARLLGASMAQNLVDSIRSTTPPNVATHRPDQTLSPERRRTVEEAVGSWHFPAHDFGMDELTYAALFMVEHLLQAPELKQYTIPRVDLMTFLLAVRRQYKHQREVHYHNWRHAVDVTQSLYCFLLDTRLCPAPPSHHRKPKQLNAVERLLTPLDALILLTSAIGHDVGHPGVNNAFLVACNHPLAQMYNDKSVLENYHCAAYSQLLRRHWPSLSGITGFRSTMISTILATDMQRHFEYMSNLADFKQKVQHSESDLDDWSDKDRENARELMMALLMKAADISNVARPFDVSAHWASILMNEFARQGELESELGIPTCLFGGPPNKEDMLAAAQSQKGFMSLFGYPLFSGMHVVMPSVSCAITELDNNQEIWDQKIAHEKQKRHSGGVSAPLTFSSVTKADIEEATARHHKSEPRVVPDRVPDIPSTPVKRQPVTDSGLGTRTQQRQHATFGVVPSDDARSSAPFLPAPAMPLPLSPTGCASRRSSKDVALDQLQQLSAYAHSNVSPSSRRGSADASLQFHQSYPGSRRGSKDESLTTILVTSQGSPSRRSSPSSAAKTPRPTGSPGKQSAKRQSVPHSQKAAARSSVPSSRSHTTSSATAATTQHSPSTQPSSLAPTEDELTPPAGYHANIAVTEDPFLVPGTWPSDLDGTHCASPPAALPVTPPLPSSMTTQSDSLRLTARMASGEPADASGRATLGKGEHGVRESRSRSRLRGLKFWKKKRDVSGFEPSDGGSPTPDS